MKNSLHIFLLILLAVCSNTILAQNKIKAENIQNTFISIISEYKQEYQQTRNEIKKTMVREKRKNQLQSLLTSLNMRNWEGKITALGTTSNGDAYIEISFNSIEIETWNNNFSDMQYNTLIPSNSEIYTSLAEMQIGDFVICDFKFIEGDRDYILEKSLTEAGSMLQPEFIVKFSKIKTK